MTQRKQDVLAVAAAVVGNGMTKQAAKDTELWQTWQKKKTPSAYKALTKQFAPLMRSQVATNKAPGTDEAGMKMHMQRRFNEALLSYNPQRGAALRTHVTNHLRKAQRHNAQQQNMAALSEAQTGHIGPLNRATDFFAREQGVHTPSPKELAAQINEEYAGRGVKKRVTQAQVRRLQRGMRRDVLGSQMASTGVTGHETNRDEAIVPLVRQELDKQRDKDVFDHMHGLNGKKRIKARGDIAKALGVSTSAVSRAVGTIERHFTKHR